MLISDLIQQIAVGEPADPIVSGGQSNSTPIFLLFGRAARKAVQKVKIPGI